MSDTNQPNAATTTALLVASQGNHHAAAQAHYAKAAEALHDIVYDSAKRAMLDPNSDPEFLFVASLFFVAEAMGKANQQEIEYDDARLYYFEDIPRVFSDKRYCDVLLSHNHTLDWEMRDWWMQYHQPSNADARHATFLKVQSYLNYLVQQLDSGHVTEHSAIAYILLEPLNVLKTKEVFPV